MAVIRKANPQTIPELSEAIERACARARDTTGARRETYVAQVVRYGAKLSELRDDLYSAHFDNGRLMRGWDWLKENACDQAETDRWVGLLDDYVQASDALAQAKAVL